MYVLFQHCFICRSSDSTVSPDAGIEPRTVATLALDVRRSSHLATSHPLLGYISSTARLHLIHCSATSHPLLGYISSTTRLHLIHYSATSHPHYSATSHPVHYCTRLHLIFCSLVLTQRPTLFWCCLNWLKSPPPSPHLVSQNLSFLSLSFSFLFGEGSATLYRDNRKRSVVPCEILQSPGTDSQRVQSLLPRQRFFSASLYFVECIRRRLN